MDLVITPSYSAKMFFDHTFINCSSNGRPFYYFFDMKDTHFEGLEASQITLSFCDNARGSAVVGPYPKYRGIPIGPFGNHLDLQGKLAPRIVEKGPFIIAHDRASLLRPPLDLRSEDQGTYREDSQP